MKSLLLLSLALMSMSSYACPDLQGRYKCEGYNLSIEQKDIGNGVNQFTVTSGVVGETYKSDNKEYDVEDSTRKASCTDTSLKVVFRLGILTTSEKYTLNKDGNLEIRTRNVIIPSKETCTKI